MADQGDHGGLLQHRDDIERGERRVPALLRIERADPHQAMHAALTLQPAVGPATVDRHRDALQPGLLALGLIEDLGSIPVPLSPAKVHAQQHLGPVLALRAASTGMDRYDRRALVIRLGEEQPSFHPRPVGRELVEVALQVGGQVGASVGLAGRQLGHLGQRLGPRAKLLPGLDLLAQLIGAAQHDLGSRGVVPEARFGGSRGQLRELEFLGGQVKGAPPCRPRGARAGAPRP